MSALSEQRRKALITTLFDRPDSEIVSQDYEIYFQAVYAEIQFLNDSLDFREHDFQLVPDQLLDVALEAVPQLRSNPEATQADIQQKLFTKNIRGIRGQRDAGAKILLDHILDGTIRIWLMVDPAEDEEMNIHGWRGERRFCDFVHGLFYPGRDAPTYPSAQGTTTRDPELVAEMASENTQIQSSLTHPLTAANMAKLTNITIHWVTRLDKHLEFDADFRNLSVFPHNRWLFDALEIVRKWRKDNEAPQPDDNTQPQPPTQLQEKIESLYSFRVRNQGEIQDRAGSKVRLKEFFFYHDRLVELAQEFMNPPKSWDTIFRDYRNPIQYWTFWIGLVIFIATLASVILAGVQVHYARQPQQ
ncbi:hypothetical protein FSARC_10767 [Fusarium sarcochroum]|uniref:Uncharacterized protein n=1 Tax=Fusarium sarcochroum TaxID=1208366 RepID=A0A8H4X357_9HYPO|nr:hypothetical protein FSARC_10767 [Fusarium sarcochroum]